MLYEKTLSRKVIGSSTQPQEAVGPDGMNDGGPPMETKRSRSQMRSIWEGPYGAMKRLFRTTNEHPDGSKQPASMGKILNLMRHGSLADSLFVSQLILRTVTTSMK